MNAETFIERLECVKPAAGGWLARCPAHEDTRASLSVGSGDGGRVLAKCHAGCSTESVVGAVGLKMSDLMPEPTAPKRRIVAEYPYRDEQGTHSYSVLRYEPKDFRQRGANGEWKVAGLRPLLFRLPELQGYSSAYVGEGEKDVDRLLAIGLPATCNAGGAGKWRDELTEQLKQAGVTRVMILPDNDQAGRDHATMVADSCLRAGIAPKIVTLPGLPAKGDVSDFIAAHPEDAAERLMTLAAEAPEYSAPADGSLAIDAPIVADDRVLAELDRLRIQDEARRLFKAETLDRVAPPKACSLSDLLAEPDDQIQYRIEGLQPIGGRGIFAAQFKAGKTTTSINLVRSLVDEDDPFLGMFRVELIPGNCGILDFEMHRHQLKHWYRNGGIRNQDRVRLWSLRGYASSFNIIDPDVRAGWAQTLRAQGITYLVLDCLRAVLDAIGLTEDKDAGKFLAAFDALLAEAGIPEAVVIVHMGHQNERARGDSRIRDWPDFEWNLVRQNEDPASPRFFKAFGRDVDVPEAGLVYDTATRRLSLVSGSRKDEGDADTIKAIIDTLRASPVPMNGIAIKEKLEGTEHHSKRVDRALKISVGLGTLNKRPGPKHSFMYSLNIPNIPESSQSTPESSQPSFSAPIEGGKAGNTQFDPRSAF